MCGVSLLVFLLLLSLCVEASVHDYKGEKFASKFVTHGGIKGIYAFVPNLSDAYPLPNLDSYIRLGRAYEGLVVLLTKILICRGWQW
ncbi:hypothetical protein JHK87_045139 [Glycine soja]|nr:hypothetical protein JHK87_045139 [Glycine soja]